MDPLDGTKEYGERREDWAVHVALAVDGACALGAVALPATGEVLWGEGDRAGVEGGGRTLVRGDSEGSSAPVVAVSRSHTPDWVAAFTREMRGEMKPFGSVGYKVSRLFFGEADIYVHQKGLKEWDTCAPEAVARALGWSVTTLSGRGASLQPGESAERGDRGLPAILAGPGPRLSRLSALSR